MTIRVGQFAVLPLDYCRIVENVIITENKFAILPLDPAWIGLGQIKAGAAMHNVFIGNIIIMIATKNFIKIFTTYHFLANTISR